MGTIDEKHGRSSVYGASIPRTKVMDAGVKAQLHMHVHDVQGHNADKDSQPQARAGNLIVGVCLWNLLSIHRLVRGSSTKQSCLQEYMLSIPTSIVLHISRSQSDSKARHECSENESGNLRRRRTLHGRGAYKISHHSVQPQLRDSSFN
jgi:hypothetical protein